jgi:hypothetical protein
MREDPADQLAVAQRKVRVVQLRLVGVPFEQVGRQLGTAMARRWHAGPRAHPCQCNRPGVRPGLSCWFGVEPPPESNRRPHPYHRWSARSGDNTAPRSALWNYKWPASSTIENY